MRELGLPRATDCLVSRTSLEYSGIDDGSKVSERDSNQEKYIDRRSVFSGPDIRDALWCLREDQSAGLGWTCSKTEFRDSAFRSGPRVTEGIKK